ncbi:MAG: geranylgeranylglyceryl/heptaprenylglyceryl phosphate synthase [Bacteroidia bacterium]|nr:geranylgeranylglyceryl/heptaprenylglyceryl phosphate synthase [Bacteroidia bacterium]NNK73796.1 geranylgeranylglyceryl/heptaprenylglyceryl phosphate synthase [Flavobacteriaceae bacterium]
MSLYNQIKNARSKGDKVLAILLDPDKVKHDELPGLIERINQSRASIILVGGSEVASGITETVIKIIKDYSPLPIVIFPGDLNQITPMANAILFLSLVSGRNPEYLIGKHVQAVPLLEDSGLEVISTAYILIENGRETSVERRSGTKPMSRSNPDKIVRTAKAAEYLGFKMVYLEAGSGAKHPVSANLIEQVRSKVNLPLIVGGGIKSIQEVELAFKAGADIVVVGTAVEEDESILNSL